MSTRPVSTRTRVGALIAAGLLAIGSGGAVAGCGDKDDSVGDDIENAADDAGNEIDQAADDAGNEIDKAADDAGDELSNDGKDDDG